MNEILSIHCVLNILQGSSADNDPKAQLTLEGLSCNLVWLSSPSPYFISPSSPTLSSLLALPASPPLSFTQPYSQ